MSLRLRPLADVQPRQVRWLLPGLIPLRTLTLVAGVGGLGKSTWLAGVAAQVTREGGKVILVSFEDPAEEVLRPRLEAAQADLERVFDVVVESTGIDTVQLPRDVDELEALVRDTEARLVVIDPIVAAMDTRLDAHKDQHVRVVLAKLADLAEVQECAIVLVGHLNKAASRDHYVRIANSVAFQNAARSVVLVTEDPADPDTLRLIAQRKPSLSRMPAVERHRIESIVLPDALDPDTGKPIETSRMVFVEQASDVDVGELLAPRGEGGDRENKQGRAREFLRDWLSDGDWHDSAGLKTHARIQGIDDRTLQRAGKDLGVEHDQRGFPASTWWRLPQDDVDEEEWASEPEPASTQERPLTPVEKVMQEYDLALPEARALMWRRVQEVKATRAEAANERVRQELAEEAAS